MQESEIFEKNLGLVGYIVNRMYDPLNNSHCQYDMSDVFQEGAIGLLKAVRTYKPDKGVQFSTYAGKCITNEILLFYRKQSKRILLNTLDNRVPNQHDDEEVTFKDLLPGYDDVEQEVLARDLKDFYKNKQNMKGYKKREPQVEKREREVYELLMAGYKQIEMVPMLGWSQRIIAGNFASIRKRIEEKWIYEKI